MEKVKRSVKGITLIALVVTIIVLLILASVAISLTIGNNGIFTRAGNAVDRYEIAAKEEQDELNKAANFIDKYMNGNAENEYNTGETVAEAKGQNKPFEKDTTIKDDLDNEVRVPEGFKIAGDSGTKVEDGIVIEDKVGNQFVWIPAETGAGITVHTTSGDKTIIYKRTDFGKQYGSYSNYSEALSTDEETSVNANGGYYIGRFEAGDKVSTDAKKMRVSGDIQTNEVSIKEGQAPYVYATYDNQKSLAEGMASVRGYTGTTKMVSSYAWDTAINFIQIKVPNYGINSPQGNYYNTTFSYINIGETEKTQTKKRNSFILVPTGQTSPVSNIYDMGGNAIERTTESSSASASVPISTRGGYFNTDATSTPAGYRGSNNGIAEFNSSFRVTLFCSTER